MSNKKSLIWSTIGISCNVFISLFFLIIIARVNTIEEVGIFSFAFALVNTLYVLGAYGGRVYQVTDGKCEFSDSDYIGFRICSSIIMVLVAILFIICNGYSIEKSIIILLLTGFKFMESISDVYYAVMQKNERLFNIGKSMTFKAIFGLGLFTIIDVRYKDIPLSILSVIIVNLLFFVFYDLKIVNKIKKVKPSFNKSILIKIGRVCFYFFAFTFLSSVVINFPRYAVDLFSTEDVQAIYGIIIMPATSIALFGQFILQPILVSITKLHTEGRKKEFSDLIKKCNILLIGFTILCEVGAYFLGIPLLEFVYDMDLKNYKGILLIVILGALFSTIASVLSTALTTMRVTKEQLIIYICTTVFAIISSIFLVEKLQLLGGVISYIAIMIFQFICYYIIYKFKIRGDNRNDTNEGKGIDNYSSI